MALKSMKQTRKAIEQVEKEILKLCCLFSVQYKNDLLLPFKPAELEIEIDFQRWRRNKSNYLQGKLTEWGSQVHFLYCTAWALLLGWGVGKKLPSIQRCEGTSINEEWDSIVLTMFCITVISAIIHHYRYLYFEKKISEKPTAPFWFHGQG